jgi:deoxyribonuclease V
MKWTAQSALPVSAVGGNVELSLMIAAFDVHYLQDGPASAAAVLFSDYSHSEPAAVYTQFLPGAADYISGEFYRRELPCILALLKQINEALDEMVVDGYVMLGNRPGLGQHLFETFDGKIPVIGVAKSDFQGSSAARVFRAGSTRPLYVTSAGVEREKAGERIRMMHGAHRVPTLLKLVDRLARENVQGA